MRIMHPLDTLILCVTGGMALFLPAPGPGEDLYWLLGTIALTLGVIHAFCYLLALRGRG